MALFGLKKDTEKKEASKSVAVKAKRAPAKKKEAAKPAVVKTFVSNSSSTVGNDVILRPRITEKSGVLSQIGVYTFEVTKSANKSMISRAVASLYKVTPIKIAIVNLPAKNVLVRGRRGVVAGTRKALVTLKKGDKIDFV
ncbi:MAG: 50S ribosomal protein L23 [Patescibacteria group bacterium]